jgi:hypothetical protein
MRPPPDYPASPYPFLPHGGLAPAAKNDPVVSVAMRYLGVPYQWGGATPKTGFDCSGLVQYVFAQLGVELPHYAAAQYYSPAGVWVRPDRLEPGDLVFFTGSDGTREAPGHVGIYVGDGYIIDAPHTGSFVRIDRLDEQWFANRYVGAKRLVASLNARHLLQAPEAGKSLPNLPLFGPRQMPGQLSGDSLAAIAAVPTAARFTPPNYKLLSGVGLGGVLLILCAGGIMYRRSGRGSRKALGSGDSPSG